MFQQGKTIGGNRFQIIKQLGQGNFAKVYLALDQKLNRYVAVKEIHQSSQAIQFIGNEINALKIINSYISNIKQKKNGVLNVQEQQILQNSKHILEIEEPFTINENDYSYVIMKCYENSIEFSQFLNTNDTLGKISERDKLYYFYQLTCGLALLHSQQICHRDLKLENILINLEQDQLVIIDFGHASLKRQDDNEACGTKMFNSPQVVLFMNYNAYKNDVWQMGIILYYLIHQRFPFCEKNSGEEELQKAIHDFMQKKRDIQIKEGASQIVKDLLTSMLQRYEDSRPSIDEVNKKLKEYLFKDKPIQNFKGPNQKALIELKDETKKCLSVLDCDFQMLKQIKKIQVKSIKQKEPQNQQNEDTFLSNKTTSAINYDNFPSNQQYQNFEVHSFHKHQSYQQSNQSISQNLNDQLNNISISQSNQQTIIDSESKHDFLSEIKIKRSQQSIVSFSKSSLIEQNIPNINENKQQVINLYKSDFVSSILTIPSLTPDINLNLIVDQFKEGIQEIEQILQSQYQDQKITKQLTFVKFYMSKLAHFLVQSLYEYAQYNQNKHWQCLYTNNFLVQWLAKTKQEEQLRMNTQDYIDLSVKLKQWFQQSAKYLQNQSISVSGRYSVASKKLFEDKFNNHCQDNFIMANEQNFQEYYQLCFSILECVQKQLEDYNQKFIQEAFKQKLQDIIQKVKREITKIFKIAQYKNLSDPLQGYSFLSNNNQQINN